MLRHKIVQVIVAIQYVDGEKNRVLFRYMENERDALGKQATPQCPVGKK